MLTATTGRKPEVVCGKPSKVMFEVAQKKFGVTSGRTLMVGDRWVGKENFVHFESC